MVLTISIDVHSAGISFSIVVCVCLVWITIVGAVVTTVTHIVSVVVILSGVVHKWTVVLFQKRERDEEEEEKNQEWYLGAVHTICHLSLNGSFHRGGVMWCEKVLYF